MDMWHAFAMLEAIFGFLSFKRFEEKENFTISVRHASVISKLPDNILEVWGNTILSLANGACKI